MVRTTNAVPPVATARVATVAAVAPHWIEVSEQRRSWCSSTGRAGLSTHIFGNLKNDAAQDVSRGNVRVMGLAKTALMTLMTVIATNLRLLDR